MPDLADRLGELRLEIAEATASRHMSEIRSELAAPGAFFPHRSRTSVRRTIVALAAAVLLLVPAAAVASDGSLPGEAMYPVKIAFERFWVVFDGDVQVRNRVEEAETMIDRGWEPELVLERLRIAESGEATVSGELRRRIDVVRDRVQLREGRDLVEVEGNSGTPDDDLSRLDEDGEASKDAEGSEGGSGDLSGSQQPGSDDASRGDRSNVTDPPSGMSDPTTTSTSQAPDHSSTTEPREQGDRTRRTP